MNAVGASLCPQGATKFSTKKLDAFYSSIKANNNNPKSVVANTSRSRHREERTLRNWKSE
jgi:hypothetical protein